MISIWEHVPESSDYQKLQPEIKKCFSNRMLAHNFRALDWGWKSWVIDFQKRLFSRKTSKKTRVFDWDLDGSNQMSSHRRNDLKCESDTKMKPFLRTFELSEISFWRREQIVFIWKPLSNPNILHGKLCEKI